MAVTLEIITIPIGSQFVQTIGSNDLDDLNDFTVLILTSENGTGLEESDITLSTGASLESLTGDGVTWEAVIRPPETAGTLTITVGADAFSEGNVETSKDIRISTTFPDADAETPTDLFSLPDSGTGRYKGIAVTPTRVITCRGGNTGTHTFHFHTHDGTEQAAEEFTHSLRIDAIDYFNGTLLMSRSGPAERRSLTGDLIETYIRSNHIVHTDLGILSMQTSVLGVLPYGTNSEDDFETLNRDFTGAGSRLAYQQSLLFMTHSSMPTLARIADNTVTILTRLNIDDFSESFVDIAIYQDTLYVVRDDTVKTLGIQKYRPLSINTKTTIYPVFANEGDTLDLTQYSPDAERFTFATGFDKPTYLSINSSNELEIASNAVTETQPVLVKFTAINRIDSQDFSFYLIIVQAANPTVRDIDDLAMYASTTFNLFDIVENATSITFRTGQTQPTGSSISNGVFTIGTVGGTAYFTATNANGSTHFEIAIDVVSVDPDNFSDTFRYRTEIAGIDVSADVKGTPTVSESIDEVRLNVVTANRVNFTLRSDSTNGFKFNGGLADNFWDANSLNADGFQEPIKVYIESLISGSYVRSLLFSGRIHEPAASINEAEVSISARDISARLRTALVSDFGTLTKWDALKQQSDAVNYEGVNVPESSLLPIQLGTGTAWSDRTKLDISRLPLSSEGPVASNTGYLTTQDFRTAGGFLASLPVLRFKTEHRAEDVRFLIKQIAINKDIYQTQIDIPAIQRDTPFILNRGSVPFSVEDTRITRLPTDWAYDSTNDRVLNLLSNPESHVADLLVQYDLGSDSYRSLHTFDTDISVHRIARRTSTDYYILSAKAISQDRSAASLPRTIDSTGYAYDSISEGSEIKILRYNASTGTLTEHVDEDDTRPPQMGIHYHIGFENALYIDEYEGIVADYRGSFKWQGSNLYYRYATPSEFGVARVNTSGTTTEMIDQTTLNYHNHLNFAFDVNSSGDIYFVYSVGDGDESSLVIKRRTSAGVETTILTDTQNLADLTVLDDAGGAYLGCHECLFHDDVLYMLCPIQRVDYDEDDDETTRSQMNAAGAILFSCNVTAATPSLTVIEKWDFVSHSACNLIVHDGAVHYTEQPSAAEKFLPINSSL